MLKVPVSTIEKPLTVVDFCAPLFEARSVDELKDYANRVPIKIRSDERFARAVRSRLEALRKAKAA